MLAAVPTIEPGGPDHVSDLHTDLRALHERLDAELRGEWQRSLPLDEHVSDRWQRAAALGFGEGSSIYATSYVYGDVTVGEGTWIGPFTILDGSGGLRIGSHCSISSGVHLYTHDTVKWALSGGVAEYERGPVEIGDCCYVGPQTIVVRGVTVGHHSVVGAGSFVNRDVAPFTVVVGSPCRQIGRVEVDGDRIELVIERD
jgi:acetyltransferase-like isoleucine patch superfamily enzyme